MSQVFRYPTPTETLAAYRRAQDAEERKREEQRKAVRRLYALRDRQMRETRRRVIA